MAHHLSVAHCLHKHPELYLIFQISIMDLLSQVLKRVVPKPRSLQSTLWAEHNKNISKTSALIVVPIMACTITMLSCIYQQDRLQWMSRPESLLEAQR